MRKPPSNCLDNFASVIAEMIEAYESKKIPNVNTLDDKSCKADLIIKDEKVQLNEAVLFLFQKRSVLC